MPGGGRESVSLGPREIKVVMVGESSVGKTALTIKFVNNKFQEHAPATIGASFLSRTMKVKVPMKFNIWDTAGQEKYRSLASLYYRGADIAVIVYDITSRSSFEQVQDYWIQELKHQCFGDDGLVLALVGNKVDLSDRRQVEEAEGRRLADDFGALFFETSAKKTPSLDDLFLALALELPESERSLSMSSNAGNVYKIHVPERKGSCCTV
ncbi:ras family-domain-containing protein [Ochromonadaceae sp. CCMP2298]|nr:ras family-domain-containing protein [Ochromonadaceae sp. CCMP2298]|mmetsp:Transcript_31106/g.68587  ORF Transcript_31106/g.68587 Transcript_31106/m.68587 type:complete len:210 (+) Transcript_31106:175-804(+)|eukprot:CAMPEP_0173191192 /NCGR_PEP_ID=MMETSP1141-20130122/12753_1 /TAXON_ID=483371 /ORGANISM="non described non described, Strain CCMP2298" /LENGTH=209 /DNA_ID=CAMNT_0014115363 /DNA_START=82 /DNA_END=711 /DNA_ORIENTATION=+